MSSGCGSAYYNYNAEPRGAKTCRIDIALSLISSTYRERTGFKSSDNTWRLKSRQTFVTRSTWKPFFWYQQEFMTRLSASTKRQFQGKRLYLKKIRFFFAGNVSNIAFLLYISYTFDHQQDQSRKKTFLSKKWFLCILSLFILYFITITAIGGRAYDVLRTLRGTTNNVPINTSRGNLYALGL